MRIWVAAGGLWHQAGLIAGLQALGHEVTNVGPVKVADCDQVKIGSWVHWKALSALPGGDALWCQWFGRRFADTLEASSHDVDLVIGWSSFMLEALQRSTRPIVVVRGSHHIQTQAELLGGEHGPSPAVVAREVAEYERATAVTVPTERIARDPRWSAGRPVRVIESPYGFPPAEPMSGRSAPEFPPRVAVVGEVGYRKGTDRVIESLAGQDVIVNLVGKPPRQRRHEWKFPPSWNVYGQIDRREVRRILADSHLLLSLSREEGMQRAGQEAMAVGTPVVATKESGLSRWLDAGAGIEIQDYTPEAVSGAIDGVIDVWTDYSRMALKVASSWTWRQHAELLLAGLD